MENGLSFSRVCKPESAQFDIVFIHGLTGSPTDTWSCSPCNEPEGGFWPKWLCADLPAAAIYTVGYPASIFGKWGKKDMNLYERGLSVLEHLTASGIGERPLIFITHSLGGLLTKQLLLTAADGADASWKALCANTRLVAFLATPHVGAALAAILKVTLPRFTSQSVQHLSNETGELDQLNDRYRKLAVAHNMKVIAYFEKYKTKNLALVVERASADPGIVGVVPVPIDSDHITICKPSNRDSPIYRSLLHRVRQHTTDGLDDSEGREYGKKVDDREDLQSKLVDAGREHEYSWANDLQNRFAQRYYKYGLFSEARKRNDALLSDIEQRFVSHVYHERICKGATSQQIAQAVQAEVIDPLATRYQGSLTEMTIREALYFLTGQCYVRWAPK